MSPEALTYNPADYTESYLRHGHYGGWMLAHIVLMILAWVFAMPLAIMLSVARSRYHLPAQVGFHALNGIAVFGGFVYNHATPDLYVKNAHHPIGWVVTSLTIVWTSVSLYTAYGDYKRRRSPTKRGQALSSSNMATHYNQLRQEYHDRTDSAQWSRDSGMGSSRQNSTDSIHHKPEEPLSPLTDPEHFSADDVDEESEKRGFLGNTRVDRFVSRYVQRLSTPRISPAVRFSQIALEKLLLLLGFVAISTGFLTYGGLARRREVFSVAAHFIKGGIFFWYGLLTLGRWMGAFTEFGWGWNIRPQYPTVARWKTLIPSAEFTESFVIWLYGCSNVFLEHLNNAGKEFSHQDFEHISITVLFFGGGLLGMLIESSTIRKMLNTSVDLQQDMSRDPEDAIWQHPATYTLSLNPMPALVIMILGLMMSAHHQTSMVSTMMHAQWGTMFFAFALARAATYVILYIKPPTSHYGSRPPTELVSAFCLVGGGLVFMISAHDTVTAIEINGLDAMTVFTVTMGLTGVIMAWEVVCFAVKGWATRKERNLS